MAQSSVHAVLPRAGLANRLLVWARAAVFAKTHGLPLYVQGWGHIHIGPLLRREKSLRYYGTFFNSPGYFRGAARLKRIRLLNSNRIITEPALDAGADASGQCFVFKKVPAKEDYFKDLRGHEEFVAGAFRKMIRQRWHDQLPERTSPFIALHVRRGDFQTVGIELSGESYFAATLARLRAATGIQRAMIFSDASADQIPELVQQPDVSLAQYDSEIMDLLEMSRADVIVTSLRSTFGYWGGFVSEAAIILDPRHQFGDIRQQDDRWFEGSIEEFENYIAAQPEQH